jgi:CelD/BcsL family acetyltransferase involved in cellulose biosynthesis
MSRPAIAHPPNAAVRVERIRFLADAQDHWRALALASRNVFATWEWANTWWRHFGHGRPLRLAACRSDDGRTVAILPLYSWRTKPLHVLRFLGHGPGDQLGPVADAADLEAAQLGLRHTLDNSSWNIFLGEQLPGGQGWTQALSARPLARTGAPVLRMRGRTWDEFLETSSSNFRQQVKRRERALFRDHDVRLHLTEDASSLPRDLDVLFALHAHRWGRNSDFFQASAFHRDFATRALGEGWLRLWLMEVDGAPAAAWYGFRFAGVESYYQSGWDSRWARSSIGSVLLSHTIREATNDGMHEYRFLQGDEQYKYRFAEEGPGLETVVCAQGLPARAAVAAGWRLRSFAAGRRAVSTVLGPE